MNRSKFIPLLLSGILIAIVRGLAQQPDSIINIPYKIVQEDTLKLDIYRPSMPTKTLQPVVVYIHGGSWISGNKSAIKDGYFQTILTNLVHQGYVVVSIDYRLVDQNTHFPSPIEDCKDAVRWIRKQAGVYRFDPANIGVWGSSAGGHLALLLAYSDDNDFTGAPGLRSFSSKVNYVVDIYGPVNLNKQFKPALCLPALWGLKLFSKALYQKRQTILSSFTGTDIYHDKRRTSRLCAHFSPINYLSGKNIPVLIIHGDKDEIVSLGQSKELADALKRNKTEYELIIYKGGKHGLMALDKTNTNDLVSRSVGFIERHTTQ